MPLPTAPARLSTFPRPSVKHVLGLIRKASGGTRQSGICENFLYVFKAARWAARAAHAATSPALPLALSLRRARRRLAGAKT